MGRKLAKLKNFNFRAFFWVFGDPKVTCLLSCFWSDLGTNCGTEDVRMKCPRYGPMVHGVFLPCFNVFGTSSMK